MLSFYDYENSISDYSKIPLDVARNHNVSNNNFYDENSFVGIYLDYEEWSDKEYLKFKNGIYQLINLSKKESLHLELGAITARLVDLFFGIDYEKIYLYFSDIDINFSEGYPEVSDRIEDFKSLIMMMSINNILDIDSIYSKSNCLNPTKEERIFRYKNKNIKKAQYIIDTAFDIKNIYYFNAGIIKHIDDPYINKSHKIFLVLSGSYSKAEKILNKIKIIGANGKIVYKNQNKKNPIYILEFDFMHEGILEVLFLNISKNQIFYMKWPSNLNYDIFNNIFDTFDHIDTTGLKRLIKQYSGILMSYADKKNKQILELKFYY